MYFIYDDAAQYESSRQQVIARLSALFDATIDLDSIVEVAIGENGRLIALNPDDLEDGTSRSISVSSYIDQYFDKYGAMPEFEYAGENLAYAD